MGKVLGLKIDSGLFMLPTNYHFQTLTYNFVLFGKPVGWFVGDFDYNTITAQLKVGLGLSLAIKAKEVLCLAKWQDRNWGDTWWTLIGELHKMSICKEKVERALLTFDSFHLLTKEIPRDQMVFWVWAKVQKLFLDFLI